MLGGLAAVDIWFRTLHAVAVQAQGCNTRKIGTFPCISEHVREPLFR